MRKCLKCAKLVPAGNRRCIYCRTVVESNATSDDDNEELDNLSEPTMDDDEASSTLFGIQHKAINQNKRQTYDEDYNNAHNTIVGLPGITFSKSPNLQNKKSTDEAPKQNSFNPYESSQENQTPVLNNQSSDLLPKQNSTLNIDENDDDPLAGLRGVQQQKISSLIEEELDDLSSELFGDDFNFKDLNVDDFEDRGLEFDTPVAKNKQPETTTHKDNKKLEETPKKQEQPTTPAKQTLTNNQITETQKPLPTKISTNSATQTQTTSSTPNTKIKNLKKPFDHLPAILALLASIMPICWIFVPTCDKSTVIFSEIIATPHISNLILLLCSLFCLLATFILLLTQLSNIKKSIVLLCFATFIIIAAYFAPWALLSPPKYFIYASATLYLLASSAFLLRKKT